MYTARQFKIIAYLVSSDCWILGSILAHEIGVSSRTIQMEIKKINTLAKHRASIISNNRLGYKLDDHDNYFYNALQMEKRSHLNLEGYFSRSKQILMLMLFEKDFITIGEIADRLFLSKSTVNTHLDTVKRVIERTPFAIFLTSPSKGIRIEAPENLKRIMIMKSLENESDYAAIVGRKDFNSIYTYQNELKPSLSQLFIQNHYMATGEAFNDFTRYLAICIYRSMIQMYDEDREEQCTISRLSNDITQIVEQLFQYTFTDNERAHISMRIDEINLLSKSFPNNEGVAIIRRLQEEIYNQCDSWIDIPYDIMKAFAEHLSRMERRVRSGRNNMGNYTNELFRQYPLAIHLLKTCLFPVMNVEITRAELGYLVYYLAAILKRREKKMSLLFVSDEGTGSVLYIKEELHMRLQDKVKDIVCIPYYMFQGHEVEYTEKHQVFLTTNKELALRYNQFILLNEIINPAQLEQIRSKVLEIDKQFQNQETARCSIALQNDITMKDKQTFSDLLRDVKAAIPDAHMSIESIGNNMLCILAHSKGTEFIQRVYLKHPMNYKRKPITRIIIAHYGRQGDMITFFNVVQRMIENM